MVTLGHAKRMSSKKSKKSPEQEIALLRAQLKLERRCNLILQNAFHSLSNRFHSTNDNLENQVVINKTKDSELL